MQATKTAYNTAAKAFAKFPSATNWKALEVAMYNYQAAHQLALIQARNIKRMEVK